MPIRVYLQVALATFLWGTAFPLIKYGLDTYHVPPLAFAGTRFVIAGCMILAFVGLLPKLANAIPATENESAGGDANWPRVLLIGCLSTALFYALFFLGMKRTSASSGAIVDGSSPIVGAIMAHFILHNDKLTPRKIAAFLLSLGGVATITLGRLTGQIAGVSAIGCLLIFSGLVVSSAGTLLVITYRGRLRLLQLMGVQMTFGGGLLLLASAAFEKWGGWLAGLDGRFVVLLLYLSLVSAVAFRIWYGLMRRYKVTSISVFSFLIASWGTALSVIFLDEPLSAQLLFGLGLVILGIVLVNSDRSGHVRGPAPGEP